jgi:hypothetical protein
MLNVHAPHFPQKHAPRKFLSVLCSAPLVWECSSSGRNGRGSPQKMAEKPSISFDAQGRVRVLDAAKFEKTEVLETECRSFVSSRCCHVMLPLHVAVISPLLLCLCWVFLPSEINEFSETVHALVEILSAQADVIEKEKLKVRRSVLALPTPRILFTVAPSCATLQAIGARNLIESEKDNRRRKQQAIQALVNEKLAELERCGPPPLLPPSLPALPPSPSNSRLSVERESLVKVEREQLELIDKLSNSDGRS